MNPLLGQFPIKYVIVSAVKDEERFVEFTIKSVLSQTLRPVLWLIVDDGSKDATPQIVERYLSTFIQLLRHQRTGVRQTGSAVIRAFNFGYKLIPNEPYDFIVKLDCDLSFEPNYFEKLFERFSEEPNLGLASGIYLEKDKSGVWKEVVMPAYHAAGACKVIRRDCFEEINGFVASAGWDTVDEIRAMSRGWRTCHFKDLRMKHHKPEGSGIGLIKTSTMHGEIYYLTGGSIPFFIFKALHRVYAKPFFLRALALVWGYLRALLRRQPKLVTETEARCYRSLLNDRLWARFKSFILTR